ncbi:sugar ABC transporter substrate-binding protein [Bifidobacterium lemurum]|uniref:Sugar ABC transporter substrate-binding protein n=1 Tax=Bifidobacterium lemurum TaxID=1603886 RepID=A0A261FRI4_9BIFI|nr:extracellular solute-binding protein [Bifidobacterium lemurum]OZG61767.1 sugar ABC transporter substrate-binding protein [Bifidobacterium lemurum]QOL34921.1 extracellular solute-binding protein [Bifidobacterium lemurum]
MKSSRKFIAAGLAVATMIGFAGCGSGETAQEENPTSIKIWHYEEDNGAQGIAWQKAMELFEEETGIKVEFEKKSFEQIRQNASQVLNSDDAPDVMEYNKGNATAGLLASQGLLTNLNDYVSQYGWDEKITGSLADTGKYNEKGIMGSGDWYGITNYGEDIVMYYNQDMFDQYGIEIPTTMDELEDAMQQFVDNGVTPLSEGVAEYPLQHLWWQLVLQKADDELIQAYEMYEGDVDWSDEAFTYATETIQDWVEKGYISQDSTGLKAEDAGQNFIKGSYPMFFSGTWWFGRFQTDMADTNWTFSLFPETEKVVGSSGNIWVIPENSTKKDAAAQFIDFTLSEEIQNLMGNSGGLPIAAEPDAITDEKTKELITSFNGVLENNALGFYPDWPTSTFYDELNASLQELVNGTADVETVLSQMEENYNKGVESAGVK